MTERLEDRALLTALDPRSLLVSTVAPPAAAGFMVSEYSRAGTARQSFLVDYPGIRPPGEYARDLAVDAAGRVHVYNGTGVPYLSTLDPIASTWTHATYRAWSTSYEDGHGGVAVMGGDVFATDMWTGSDGVGGLVRFDIQDAATTNPSRVAGSEQYKDVAAGLNGVVYGLEWLANGAGSIVRKYDPVTGASLGKLTLGTTEDVRGIAVDAAENIFAVSWEGSYFKFDAAGNLLVRRNANELGLPTNSSGTNRLIDIDVAKDGTVVIGGAFGDVYLTDTALTQPSRFETGFGPAYVAFASYQVPAAMICGTVFSDRDGDGVRDVGEQPKAGVTVYLDLDRDGTLDAAEPTATTLADGSYRFSVAPGEYVVRQVVPAGFVQTSPKVYATNNAGHVYYAGARTYDAANRQVDELWRIDAFSGEATKVGPSGVALHGLVRTNDGRLFAINGYNNGNDGFYSVDPSTGRTTLIGLVGADLAWGLAYDAVTDTIYGIGHVNNSGFNRLGTFNRLTGRFTPIPGGNGASAADLDRTSGIAFDPIKRRVVAYEHGDGQTWEFTLDGTARKLLTEAQAAAIAGAAMNLGHDGRRFVMKRDFGNGAGDLLEFNPDTGTLTKIGAVPVWFIAESLEFIAHVGGAHTVTVGETGSSGPLDFGLRPPAGEIHGTVWNDLDFDGVRDEGEPGRGGVTVFVDLNNNGYHDLAATWTETVDPDAYWYGTSLDRLNQGLTLTAVNADGTFFDTVKALGQHSTLGQLFGHREPYGAESILWGHTFPQLRADFAARTGSVSVTVRAYSTTSAASIWAYDAAGNVLAIDRSHVTSAGSVTLTVNASGIAYVLVKATDGFLLIDKLSFTTPSPEPTAVTAADGSYSFTGLTPGRYFVGEVTPRGWARWSYGNERDVFYGVAYVPNGGGAVKLVTIDARTGQVEWIGDPLPVRLHGLIRTNAGELYGTSYFDDRLYAVDPATGRMSLVGSTGWSIVGGLAYDAGSDTIYSIGKVSDADAIARLLVIDRRTGRGTAIGPGIGDMTGTSGLAYDARTNRVIAFDNADKEFYAFDYAGNATLLSTGSNNLDFWGLSATSSYGFVALTAGSVYRFLATIDPATATFGEPVLTLSEPTPLEALDWNYHGGRYIVEVDGVATGVDFGIYDANWSPSAHAGGPYEVREGESVTFSGAKSSDEDDDPLTYEWDLNFDGTYDATGVSPTFTWQQLVAAGMGKEGTYKVRLRVKDLPGSSSLSDAPLKVLNGNPVVTSLTLDPVRIDEGGTATVSGSFTDAGPLDTHVVVIDWGDGTSTTIDPATGGTFSRPHVYADVSANAAARYQIRVTVRDGDGGTVTETRFLDVTRPAPRALSVLAGYGPAGSTRWADLASLAGRTQQTAPWQVTYLRMTFDRDAAVDLADLSVKGASGATLPLSEFAYDAATRTATWKLAAPVESDRLRLVLDGDDATSDGNVGVSHGGTLLAGGDRAAVLNVLFGDVNGNGTVTVADAVLARNAINTTDIYADVNGNGTVTVADAVLVRNRINATLPPLATPPAPESLTVISAAPVPEAGPGLQGDFQASPTDASAGEPMTAESTTPSAPLPTSTAAFSSSVATAPIVVRATLFVAETVPDAVTTPSKPPTPKAFIRDVSPVFAPALPAIPSPTALFTPSYAAPTFPALTRINVRPVKLTARPSAAAASSGPAALEAIFADLRMADSLLGDDPFRHGFLGHV